MKLLHALKYRKDFASSNIFLAFWLYNKKNVLKESYFIGSSEKDNILCIIYTKKRLSVYC